MERKARKFTQNLLKVDQGGRRKRSEEMCRIGYKVKWRNMYFFHIGENRAPGGLVWEWLQILQRHNCWRQHTRPRNSSLLPCRPFLCTVNVKCWASFSFYCVQ